MLEIRDLSDNGICPMLDNYREGIKNIPASPLQNTSFPATSPVEWSLKKSPVVSQSCTLLFSKTHLEFCRHLKI